jgi:phosphopantothenoylcysteine synthetase/decarboxylase
MRILITAGNTQVLIDKVRCITNIFTGRTGTRLALHARERGHAVTLLTSHPEVVAELHGTPLPPAEGWTGQPYRTFEDLQDQMETALQHGSWDAVIHCAAVSDYRVAGIFAPAPGTHFHAATGRWEAAGDEAPALVSREAGKVKSDEPELWLRLTRTPKLIDRVRSDWYFRGVLVKFKLEVGLDDAQLLQIAERSRVQSAADLMVANTLEGMADWAYLGPLAGRYERVARSDLPTRLIDAVEQQHEERTHG